MVYWNNIDELIASIGLDANTLYYFARNKNKYIRTIPKLKPNGEIRQIIAPQGDYKSLLKKIDKKLKTFVLPKYFYGSRKGVSAIDCALVHRNSDYILKLDLEKYYDNINHIRVGNTLNRITNDSETRNILVNLCTFNKILPQGFPTSPSIAEMTLLNIARRIDEICNANSFAMSIYIDDIIISGGQELMNFKDNIIDLFKKMRFKLNPLKIKFDSVDDGSIVTGVLVKRDAISTTPAFDAKLDLNLEWLSSYVKDYCNDDTIYSDELKKMFQKICGQIAWENQINYEKSSMHQNILNKILCAAI